MILTASERRWLRTRLIRLRNWMLYPILFVFGAAE